MARKRIRRRLLAVALMLIAMCAAFYFEPLWVVKRALESMLTGNDVTDAELPTLHMPVLILWGSLDRIAPLSEGRAMHALIPQSRLEIAPGCGHLAPQQCSAVLGPELLRFLNASPPLPAGDATLIGAV